MPPHNERGRQSTTASLPPKRLDSRSAFCFCSHMPITTLGEAWRLGWRIRVRCLLVGRKPKTRDRTAVFCDTTTELDMNTLVWTRGEAMPLDRLSTLFRCPKCGSPKITVAFHVPNQPKA